MTNAFGSTGPPLPPPPHRSKCSTCSRPSASTPTWELSSSTARFSKTAPSTSAAHFLLLLLLHLLLLNESELLTEQQQQTSQSTLADCRLSNALQPSIKLLNYEDVFWLEQNHLLYLRATARGPRTYELFLLVRLDCAAKQQHQHHSQRFRIVIQVNVLLAKGRERKTLFFLSLLLH